MWNINRSKCIYCGACVGVCPFLALRLREVRIEVNPKKCTLCGTCAKACPMNAISVDKDKPNGVLANPKDCSE